jgi:TM2 domain-containing membrane protein YozV
MQKQKSRGAAVALALFLGGIGAHKFYLDRPGWGILYALFFWTFIPAIAAFFEAIYLAVMPRDMFEKKYCN